MVVTIIGIAPNIFQIPISNSMRNYLNFSKRRISILMNWIFVVIVQNKLVMKANRILYLKVIPNYRVNSIRKENNLIKISLENNNNNKNNLTKLNNQIKVSRNNTCNNNNSRWNNNYNVRQK